MGKTCMNATAAAGLSLSVVHNMIWLLYVILRWLQNVAHKNDISVEGGGESKFTWCQYCWNNLQQLHISARAEFSITVFPL